jgi:hypothetical protein
MSGTYPTSVYNATDYQAFANGFAFRYVRPHDPITVWWSRIACSCLRAGSPFDFLNTRFPKGSGGVKLAIKPLCQIPRMSTPAIAALINRGVAAMPWSHVFVNVGVWNGFTFLSGLAGNSSKLCIGVDNFSQFGGPKDSFLARFERLRSANHRFYDMDYKEYFQTVHREPIGFYLYDGEHSYQNQLDGLRLAERFFGPNCYIMIDDTNDQAPRAATSDFVRSSRNEYETILDVTTCANMHPTWWNGIMVLRRVG